MITYLSDERGRWWSWSSHAFLLHAVLFLPVISWLLCLMRNLDKNSRQKKLPSNPIHSLILTLNGLIFNEQSPPRLGANFDWSIFSAEEPMQSSPSLIYNTYNNAIFTRKQKAPESLEKIKKEIKKSRKKDKKIVVVVWFDWIVSYG